MDGWMRTSCKLRLNIGCPFHLGSRCLLHGCHKDSNSWPRPGINLEATPCICLRIRNFAILRATCGPNRGVIHRCYSCSKGIGKVAIAAMVAVVAASAATTTAVVADDNGILHQQAIPTKCTRIYFTYIRAKHIMMQSKMSTIAVMSMTRVNLEDPWWMMMIYFGVVTMWS